MQPNAPVPFGPPPQIPNNPYLQPKKSAAGAGLIFGILFALTFLALIGAGAFAAWAYSSRQDYKDNVDKKVAVAVKVAEQRTSSTKDNEFAEKEKSPLKEYKSPSTYGAVSIMYPKSWSAYVNESGSGNYPIDGYFHPNFVPNITPGISIFALRVQVSNQSYAKEMQVYDSLVKGGKLKVSPYTAPKVPSVNGALIEGSFTQDKSGSMVLLPLRDKTIKVFTESTQFNNDFRNFVLANLTFEP